MPMLSALGPALLLAAALATTPAPAATSVADSGAVAWTDPDSGEEMLGRPAPEWSFDRWIATPPLTLAGLRGHVVLLRWWTDQCHFCAATLPELEQLRTAHAKDSLVVVGAYDPHPRQHLSDARIRSLARRLGYTGAIAADDRQSTLDRWWLDGHPERNWTSISFLIDRDGIVRWVHGGGEYHHSADPRHARCDVACRELEAAIAAALAP